MRASILSAAALAATLASGAPAGKRDFSPDNTYFPLANGFPNPSSDAILQIQKDGHGTLPNGPLPATLSQEGIINLQLIALNELFEVAFFTELVHNLTNKYEGYDLGYGQEYILDALSAVVAQEQMHLLNANKALEEFKVDPIQPCKYNFPVTDFQSAIALAGTFTDLVLGTLQDVNELFARNQDFDLVRAVSSVIGNEAEQEGLFRLVQKKRPSAQPFLTGSAREFAFTAIQSFMLPNSCPNIDTIPLKTFKPLTVESKDIKRETQNLKFSISKKDAEIYEVEKLRLVLINGQNKPIVESFQNVQMLDDKVVFEAAFPWEEFVMDGLTIAAVAEWAKETDEFAGVEDVAAKTIFGPGIIELS
ncbi:hypothetical protein BDW02DRAFT_509826 [Decorospora gaudefroyi]|uniref:Late sexual development protein n=1 Tax=Decorospora gaudefroyi TaxID=184978 RepID=A0A6A5K066_9PLEO|nr:hypothetical protein BDW02DRAFT_509826 [Decorospora gaudefroyi]